MDGLRIVFCGTGDLVVPAMRAVVAAGRDTVLAAVTQPPRPAGRGRKLTECPAALAAQELGLPLLQPENVNDEDDAQAVSAIEALRPDVVVVAAYGQFLRRRLLGAARLGTINIHPSLLPKYRGATPMQRALENGDAETGVSVLYVTPRMDAGDLLDQSRTAIGPAETYPELAARLAEQGARQLLDVLDRFREAQAPLAGTPQDESQVVLAPLLDKAEGRVDWSMPARRIYNRWRAFLQWPGSVAALPDGTPLKLVRVEWRDDAAPAGAAPGQVVAADGASLTVATGEGTLRILEAQPAGKGAMPAGALVNGRRVAVGDVLG